MQKIDSNETAKVTTSCIYNADIAVKQVAIAGSYRRVKETVGDLDIVAAAANTQAVIPKFSQYGEIEEILSADPTRSSALLKGGLQVDLRVVAPLSFGAALLYFTGSKSHNIALRRIAQEQGYKLNEYGLLRDGHCYLCSSVRYDYPHQSCTKQIAVLDTAYVLVVLINDLGKIE